MAEIETDDYPLVFALDRDGALTIFENGSGEETTTRLLGVAHQYAIHQAVQEQTLGTVITNRGGCDG